MNRTGNMVQPQEMERLPPESIPGVIAMRDLGRMGYAEALAVQRRLQRKVIEGREDVSSESGWGFLLLVEHVPPVITISRRKGAKKHLLAPPETLEREGVEVCETDRGGDITYHGPGQLVVYPILDLNRLNLRLHGYMRFLEQVVIDVLAEFGIEGLRDAEATGVWISRVGTAHQDGNAASMAKICALGVRLSRWVSMHGLALNVNPDLSHFDHIIPCGLPGRGVTSINEILGEDCPSMEEVKKVLVKCFRGRVSIHASSTATTLPPDQVPPAPQA